jgi:hypothetical protein
VGKNVVNFTLLELLSRFYAEVASDYWSLHELPKRTRDKMTDNQVQVC